jgi:hypothetical protein
MTVAMNCPRCGARRPLFSWPPSWRHVLWGGWTCRQCGCEIDFLGRDNISERSSWGPFLTLFRKYLPTRVQKLSVLPAHQNVGVHIESERDRAHVATEKVRVPRGVSITVKRSRTIEHTIDISGKIGLQPIISASVRGEIERRGGQARLERETVEYEVALNGQQSEQYELEWTDIWCKGIVEFENAGKTEVLPFRFQERTELEVKPTSC